MLAAASCARCSASSSALPTLRLRGDYLAIVTLGFGEIIPQVVRNGDSLHGFNLTNGTHGISPIDPLGFGHDIPIRDAPHCRPTSLTVVERRHVVLPRRRCSAWR